MIFTERFKRKDIEIKEDKYIICELDFSSGFLNKRPLITESGRQMVSTFLSKS